MVSVMGAFRGWNDRHTRAMKLARGHVALGQHRDGHVKLVQRRDAADQQVRHDAFVPEHA